MRPVVAVVVIAVAMWAAPAWAAPAAPAFAFEATAGASWRASISPADRAPGFSAGMGSAEVLAGLTVGPIGVVAGGRAGLGLAGQQRWMEFAGDLALELILGERVRGWVGFDGGKAFYADTSAWFAGGFLSMSFDVVQFGSGRTGLCALLRLDIDNFLTDSPSYPSLSTALQAGFGWRY